MSCLLGSDILLLSRRCPPASGASVRALLQMKNPTPHRRSNSETQQEGLGLITPIRDASPQVRAVAPPIFRAQTRQHSFAARLEKNRRYTPLICPATVNSLLEGSSSGGGLAGGAEKRRLELADGTLFRRQQ
ncbi:UNVERIFIED_CONTAM: hypothetical protein K2H54_054499 [Gekko kuhli]